MSGNLIGGVVGAAIGFVVSGGNPMGALYGFSIGSAAGALLLPTDLPTQYGPRLSDLKAQASEYGAPIPIVYGTVALQGTVIWAADLKEVATEQDQGGKGGPSQTTVSYSYYGSMAVLVSEGPIAGVLRIFAGPSKRLIWDGTKLESGSMRVYLGDENQLPDPLMEQALGVGNVPAYRGACYVVLEDFALANDGNALPFLTFEVSSAAGGGVCGTDYQLIGTAPNQLRLYDRAPVKIGAYAAPLALSSGEHPVCTDSQGNVYALLRAYTGVYKWYLTRVSTNNPSAQISVYLGAAFDTILNCSMAHDPNVNRIGIIQEATTNYIEFDCTAGTLGPLALRSVAKADIIYSPVAGRLRLLDYATNFVSGELSADCYGFTGVRFGGRLIECGGYGYAIRTTTATWLPTGEYVPIAYETFDTRRNRLTELTSSIWGRAYYDFPTGVTVVPADPGEITQNEIYLPALDRIISSDNAGLSVWNPADFNESEFPIECRLFAGRLAYADGAEVNRGNGQYLPVPLPHATNWIVVVPTGAGDIFMFPLGFTAQGVTLASVVADLSERAGESRYDVTALEADTVDGYAIARQTEVRAAIDALRPAYYFDAVESQGVIRYVKRGGDVAAVIDDADLAARDAGGEAPDPLQTVRRMEVELPRAVNVRYLLAASDYDSAAKQARRLIGSSGGEQTLEMPLVLTDTKAQEIAEVNLHAAWVERLSYQFNLPRKYSHLEPTDLVLVKGHLVRLTSVKATPRGVLECAALADESAFYAPHVVVTETPPTINKPVATPGQTRLELF